MTFELRADGVVKFPFFNITEQFFPAAAITTQHAHLIKLALAAHCYNKLLVHTAGQKSAINSYYGAGNKARGIRGEEYRSSHHLSRIAIPAHRRPHQQF